jgi:photosystem II stability/assembly factor-like uncharacterized protein
MKNLLMPIVILIAVSGYCHGQKLSAGLDSQQSNEWNIISEVSGSMWEIFFTDSLNGWVAGDSGKIYATDDGGKTWLPQNSGTESILRSIYFMDEKTGFAAGYNQTLLRTNNGGDLWETVEIRGDSGLIFSSLGPDSFDNIYFISNFGEVHYSIDSGVTWNNGYQFNQYGFSYLNCTNSPACYAMQLLLGQFYKSTNGGKEWEKKLIDIRYSGDIFFLNESIGWVSEDWRYSSEWHDSVSLYITLDGGETWKQQSTLEGKSLDNIVFGDTFEGWLSVRSWIYYSSDSGKSWTSQFVGDSSDYITDIFFLNCGNGWAVTYLGKIIKYCKPVEVSVVDSDRKDEYEFVILQNYPNPFNPSTTIVFKAGIVTNYNLQIINTIGQVVFNYDGLTNAGTNKFVWTGGDNITNRAASGMYLYKISFNASEKILSGKMILVK